MLSSSCSSLNRTSALASRYARPWGGRTPSALLTPICAFANSGEEIAVQHCSAAAFSRAPVGRRPWDRANAGRGKVRSTGYEGQHDAVHAPGADLCRRQLRRGDGSPALQRRRALQTVQHSSPDALSRQSNTAAQTRSPGHQSAGGPSTGQKQTGARSGLKDERGSWTLSTLLVPICAVANSGRGIAVQHCRADSRAPVGRRPWDRAKADRGQVKPKTM